MFMWKEGNKYQLRTGDLDRYAKFKVRELLPKTMTGH